MRKPRCSARGCSREPPRVGWWHLGPVGSDGSERDVLRGVGAAWDPGAAGSWLGFELVRRALGFSSFLLLLTAAHSSGQQRLSPQVSPLPNVALPGGISMASSGVPVVRAKLVKGCRGSTWEPADVEVGTLQGWGSSPSPLLLQTRL